MCHCLTLFLLDIHDMLHSWYWMEPHLSAFVSSMNIVLYKQGQWFSTKIKELRYSAVWSFAYGALSISYLVSACKSKLFEVHLCSTIFTSKKCASPIGLDCKILQTRLVIQDKEGEKIEKHIYEQIGCVYCCNSSRNFYFETKMILLIDNNGQTTLLFPFSRKLHCDTLRVSYSKLCSKINLVF